MSMNVWRGARGRAVRLWGPLMVAIALGLPGCVSVQVARDPVTQGARADEGTVVVSVTLNTGEVTQFDVISLLRVQPGTGEPEKGGPQRLFQLSNTLQGLSRDTALFTGVLPAGEYRLSSLSDVQTQKYLMLNEAQAALTGNFTVQPGSTVDLGRLVLTGFATRVVLGRSERVTGNRDLIARFAPDYLALYRGTTQTGWTQPHVAADTVEALAFARPQGATGLSALSSGEVLGGTRMGTVLKRDRDGRWAPFARTGGLDAILWTVPYEAGDVIAVAAGELGTLVSITRTGEVRAIDAGDLPAGNIFFIDRARDGSGWIAGVVDRKEAVLLQSPTLERGTWTRMRGDSVQFSAWSGARMVWAWPYAGGVGYASTSSRKVACYDYATQRWSERDAPGKRAITAVAASPAGPVGVLTSPGGGFGGIFASTHYTMDCGANWVETASPYKVKVMAPLVLPSGTVLEAGGVFKDSGLYASRVGSATWEKRSDRVDFNEAIMPMPTAGLFAVSRGQFGFEAIMHSADEGRTWEVESTSLGLPAP